MTNSIQDIYGDSYWREANDKLIKTLIKTLDAQEVLVWFDFTFRQNYEYRIALVERLVLLCKEDKSNIRLARKLVSSLLKKEEKIPSSRRMALDTTLLRLVHLLKPQEQLRLSKEFIRHRRSSRRKVGFKLIELFSHPSHERELIECFERYKDENALITLIKIDSDISDIAEIMLENITLLRQQAGVFAKLVKQNYTLALELSRKYPVAFVWGVGRSQHQKALPAVLEIIRYSKDDYEKYHHHIGLLIWALGKLDAKEELFQLAEEYSIIANSS